MEISTNGDIHTEIFLQMWIWRYLQIEISKIATNEDIYKWRYPQIEISINVYRYPQIQSALSVYLSCSHVLMNTKITEESEKMRR